MTVQPTDVVVLEESEVLARGLCGFLSQTLPESTVRVVPGADVEAAQRAGLVVCGPTRLRAFSGSRQDFAHTRPAALAVVSDASKVDFAAVLAGGIEVLWDYRGSAATFAAAVHAALRGQAWVSDSLTAPMASDIGVQLRRGLQAADYGLTPRESEVLQLMATGGSNRDIASALFISQNTVKNHVRAVLDKLHAASRTEAVIIGARVGLVDVRGARP